MSAVLQRFREKLPRKPYCTNNFAYGVRILLKNTTILVRFTQQNQPHILCRLPFDVDRMGASIDWSNQNCLTPSITVEDPRNGHARLLYALALPVKATPDASTSALRYTVTVECVLCEKLNVDVNYSGLICKNPCHPEWQEVEQHEEPYALDGLVDYLDLNASTRHSVDKDYGLGRNYHLFGRARKQAYRTTHWD